MLDPKDFRNYHWYKYVVFADGVIKFGHVDVQHTNIINKDIPAIGAGKIKHHNGVFSFYEKGSLTRKLEEACQPEVKAYLEGLGIMEAEEGEAFYE